MENQDKQPSDKTGQEMLSGMGGIFEGVSNLLGRLSELAEKGQELKRASEQSDDPAKGSKPVFDYSVKFGSAAPKSDGFKVQPLSTSSNSRPVPTKKNPPSAEDREPQVDVFEEPDHLLIVAEMPGVGSDNVQLKFEGCHLELTGKTPRMRFFKSIELPYPLQAEDATINLNNGIVEITLKKPSAD